MIFNNHVVWKCNAAVCALSVEHFVFVADFEKDYFAPMPLSEITECQWCSDYLESLSLTTIRN
jgi:hypothetical protein